MPSRTAPRTDHHRLAPPAEQPISAQLAAAGSVRHELEDLLAAAPPDASLAVYRELLLQENVAGKRSTVAREKAWVHLKARYLLDPSVPEYRTFAVAMRGTSDPGVRGPLCLLMLARVNRLFREVTLGCVSPHLGQANTVIDPMAIHDAVLCRVSASGAEWSPITLKRVRQHILSSLKDFGVLRGSATKRTVTPRVGTAVALFATRLAKLEGLTDRQVLDAVWFRLLGLDRDRAIDVLYAVARSGLVTFRLQADVVELSLPPEGTA